MLWEPVKGRKEASTEVGKLLQKALAVVLGMDDYGLTFSDTNGGKEVWTEWISISEPEKKGSWKCDWKSG